MTASSTFQSTVKHVALRQRNASQSQNQGHEQINGPPASYAQMTITLQIPLHHLQSLWHISSTCFENFCKRENACDWNHEDYETGSPIETPCLSRSKNLDTIIRTSVVSSTAHAASQHLTTGFRVNQKSKPRYSPPPGKCTPNMWSRKRWVARRRTRTAALVATCKRSGDFFVLQKGLILTKT
jgi:hypothetical protein